MPRRKLTDLQKGKERAENAKKYIGQLSDAFIKRANERKLSQVEFDKAVQALRSIVADSHITGIRVTTPKFSLESLDRDNLVIKISIGTAKTRKQFSIRRRL